MNDEKTKDASEQKELTPQLTPEQLDEVAGGLQGQTPKAVWQDDWETPVTIKKP